MRSLNGFGFSSTFSSSTDENICVCIFMCDLMSLHSLHVFLSTDNNVSVILGCGHQFDITLVINQEEA